MILHVASLDKFIPPFIKFINDEFGEEKHLFCVLGTNKKYLIDPKKNVRFSTTTLVGALTHYCRIIKHVQRADKIILHGLFDLRLIFVISLMPWVLKKCCWVIWGGDLYFYQKPKPRKRDKLTELLRKFAIKRIGYLITYIPGDIELARKWYNAQGVYKECLMYLSNVVDADLKKKTAHEKRNSEEVINILVGNSADPSNNHIEILDKLAPYKNQNIKIIVPLSYGDKEYAKRLIDYGRDIFGEKFQPLINFLPLCAYNAVLDSIRIAVFNHERQQAMGNTITLLGMGKTVYMRTGFSHSLFLKELGLCFLDVGNLSLAQISDEASQLNRRIVSSYFSKTNLKLQLQDIFE